MSYQSKVLEKSFSLWKRQRIAWNGAFPAPPLVCRTIRAAFPLRAQVAPLRAPAGQHACGRHTAGVPFRRPSGCWQAAITAQVPGPSSSIELISDRHQQPGTVPQGQLRVTAALWPGACTHGHPWKGRSSTPHLADPRQTPPLPPSTLWGELRHHLRSHVKETARRGSRGVPHRHRWGPHTGADAGSGSPGDWSAMKARGAGGHGSISSLRQAWKGVLTHPQIRPGSSEWAPVHSEQDSIPAA